jgi:hypothetical protein
MQHFVEHLAGAESTTSSRANQPPPLLRPRQLTRPTPRDSLVQPLLVLFPIVCPHSPRPTASPRMPCRGRADLDLLKAGSQSPCVLPHSHTHRPSSNRPPRSTLTPLRPCRPSPSMETSRSSARSTQLNEAEALPLFPRSLPPHL